MEENKQVPELTVPQLTLDETPVLQVEEVIAQANSEIAKQEEKAPVVSETKFTPQEQQVIDDFAQKIDISNTNIVIQYGSGAQKHIANFSETALDKVRTKDMGETGKALSSLVAELQGFSALSEAKGLRGLFKKAGNTVARLKAGYAKAEANVENVVEILEGHQVTLLKDIAMFGKMYEMNINFFKELSMYIAAGKKKLDNVTTVDIPALKTTAQQSGLAEDAQKANDLENMANRFEKRIYDLELTRNISLQMGPQIRLVQNNDCLMVEKIQSSLVNTIPLWKSQMVLALGIENSRQALEAQKKVTEMTNTLLKQNAELLKQASIETARESERGIVDVETLVETNNKLITTIDEVIKIQKEGHEKRQVAEQQLATIENDLKTKLLEIGTK
jgi:uncharacterized protein YaaN involved in tellurite resistance